MKDGHCKELGMLVNRIAATILAMAMITGSTNSSLAQQTTSDSARASIDHYNHAVKLHKAGSLDQAIVEYKAAIKAHESREYWSNLGLAYSAKGLHHEAIAAFKKALAQGSDAATIDGYACVLHSSGRAGEAIEQWKLAIKMYPEYKPAYTNLAAALLRAKRFGEVKEILAKIGTTMRDPTTTNKIGDFLRPDGQLLSPNQ
jgi:tetratricopeptide (TPR) repeat protein